MSRSLAVVRTTVFMNLEKLLMAMLRHALLNDVAGGHIEGRKQRRRAMTLVIVGERAGAPALEREAWLGAIQGLDLALLIKREDDSPLGRLQVQPDDIPEFFHERRGRWTT